MIITFRISFAAQIDYNDDLADARNDYSDGNTDYNDGKKVIADLFRKLGYNRNFP